MKKKIIDTYQNLIYQINQDSTNKVGGYFINFDNINKYIIDIKNKIKKFIDDKIFNIRNSIEKFKNFKNLKIETNKNNLDISKIKNINQYKFISNKNAIILAFDEVIGQNTTFEGNSKKISNLETIKIINFIIENECYTKNINKELCEQMLNIILSINHEYTKDNLNKDKFYFRIIFLDYSHNRDN